MTRVFFFCFQVRETVIFLVFKKKVQIAATNNSHRSEVERETNWTGFKIIPIGYVRTLCGTTP